MKRIGYVVISSVLMLTSCYHDFYCESLKEYIERIEKEDFGFSEYGLDHPKNFLPSYTFLNDYKYLSGKYYLYEEDTFKLKKELPTRCLIVLQYDPKEYISAKDFTISNISMFQSKSYIYNDYYFYVNGNYMNSFIEDQIPVPVVPYLFTMVGYNDEKNILSFIGFYNNNYEKLDKKYYNDFEGNFTDFIDLYYKEWFDFNK